MVDSSSNAFIKKGDDFQRQAAKKRKGSTFGNIFFSSQGDRNREALDLYTQAANCYKAANQRDLAVQCLLNAVECEPEHQLKASYFNDMAKIIKSNDTEAYHKYTRLAIDQYLEAGRHVNAANLSKDAAEKAEEDLDYELATALYEKAAGHYDMDSQGNQANNMWVKWADLKILIISDKALDFAKIIKTYEKVGMKQLSQGLAKALAKDYFFKSGLCYLANKDMTGCRNAMMTYSIEDPSFENDTKYKLIVKLIEACEQRDRELFKKSTDEYQKFRPMDKIQTKLVVKAKTFYCPEPESVVDHIDKKINLVDSDDDDDKPAPQHNPEPEQDDGYDFT